MRPNDDQYTGNDMNQDDGSGNIIPPDMDYVALGINKDKRSLTGSQDAANNITSQNTSQDSILKKNKKPYSRNSPKKLSKLARIAIAVFILVFVIVVAFVVYNKFRANSTTAILSAGSSLDTDKDGLSDYAETHGMYTQSGQIIFTNPQKADSDGDDISDGKEMGKKIDRAYQMLSDPTMKDTDGDGFGDKVDADPLATPPKDNKLDKYIAEKYPNQLTLTIVVDQPVPNSRVMIANWDVSGDENLGHTFIRFDKYTKKTDGSTVKQAFYRGFYPDNTGLTSAEVISKFFHGSSMPGAMGNQDYLESWNIAKVFVINEDVTNQILNTYLPSYENKKYDPRFDNCTTFAVNTFVNNKIANFPVKEHLWTIPDGIRSMAVVYKIDPKTNVTGYNPADAGEDIRASGGYVEYRSLK